VQPGESPSAKAPVVSTTGQLAPGDRPAPPAPTPFAFPASALPKVSDIEKLLKQSSISAASGAAESAISRFEPWLHWQSEGPKPTDNLESVVVSYITKHRPTPTSISQIEASLRSSMKKNYIHLSSGTLNSVLGDYLDLPPGASPTPSPSDTVQSFVISWLSKNRPLPTSMDADAAKISKILYKGSVATSRGALLSALNHYRASPTAAPSDAVQTVVVSYYNAEHAKSAIGDIFNQSSMTVKPKDFDKAFGRYYHPTPITAALPTPSTPIETVVASYLAEHNEGGYPGPYLASSLIPLKESLAAILGKEKIPAPTGALDSAISRFHDAASAPTPTNSLEGALVSYLAEQKDKSAIASILSAAHTSLGKHQDKSINSVYHRFAHPTGSQPAPMSTNYVESVALGYFARQRNTSALLGQSWQGSSLTQQLAPSKSIPTGAPELTSLFGSAVPTPLPGFSRLSSALGASQTGSITNQIKAFQDIPTGIPQSSSSSGGLSSQASNSDNIVAPTAAFSELSSVLGASKAAPIINQITASPVIPTEAPQVSSSLGQLSSQIVNAEKLTAPTSLPSSEDLSSALGASSPFPKQNFKNVASQVISTGVPGLSSVSNQIPSSQNVNAEASATISSLPVDMPVSMSLSAPALAPSSSVPRTEMPESTSISNSGSVMQAAAMSQPSSNIESLSMVFSAPTSGFVPEILSASNILSSSPGSVAKSDITSFESSSIYPTRLPKSGLSSDLSSELRSYVESVVASEADFRAKHFADSQTTAVSRPVSSSSPMISSVMSEGTSKPTSVAASNIASVSGISPSIKSESSSIETIMSTSTGGIKSLFSSAFRIISSQSADELSTTGEIQPTFMAQSAPQQTLSSVGSFEATSTHASERLPGFSSFISSWKAQSSLAAAQSSPLRGSEGLSSPTPLSGLSVASSSPLSPEFVASTSSSQASIISKSFESILATTSLFPEQSSSARRATESAIATSSAIPIASPLDQSSISSSVQASLTSDFVQKTASLSNTPASRSAPNQIASFSQSSNSESMYSSALAQQSNPISTLQAESTFHAKQFNVLKAGLKSSTKAIPTAASAKPSNSPMKASTSIPGESSIISFSSHAMQSESSQAMTKSLPLSSSLAIQSLASVSARESLSSEQYAISASRSLSQSSAFSASQVVSATQNIGSPSASVASQLSMSTAVSPSKSLELTSEKQPTLMAAGTSSSGEASASLAQTVSATSAQVQLSIINALEMLSSSTSATLASEVSPSTPIASVQASQLPSVVVSKVPLSSEASPLSAINAESSIIQSSSSVTNTPSTAVNTVSNVPNMASETLTSMAISSLGASAQQSAQSSNLLSSATLPISSSEASPISQITPDANMLSSMAVSQPQNVASEAQSLSSVGQLLSTTLAKPTQLSSQSPKQSARVASSEAQQLSILGSSIEGGPSIALATTNPGFSAQYKAGQTSAFQKPSISVYVSNELPAASPSASSAQKPETSPQSIAPLQESGKSFESLPSMSSVVTPQTSIETAAPNTASPLASQNQFSQDEASQPTAILSIASQSMIGSSSGSQTSSLVAAPLPSQVTSNNGAVESTKASTDVPSQITPTEKSNPAPLAPQTSEILQASSTGTSKSLVNDPSQMGLREQSIPESVASQTSLLQQKTSPAYVAPSAQVENTPGAASTTETIPSPMGTTLSKAASFATSMTSATPEAESADPGANTAISQSDKAMVASEMPTELNSSQVFASNSPLASTLATAQTRITINVPQVTQLPMDTTFQGPSAVESPPITSAPSEAVLAKTIISIDTTTITVTDHGPKPSSDAQPTNVVSINGFYSSAPAPEPKLTSGSEMDYVTVVDMEKPEPSIAAKEFYDATKPVSIPDSSLSQNLTPIIAVAPPSPTLQYATAIDLARPEPSLAAEDSYNVNNLDFSDEDSTSPQSTSHNSSSLGHSDELSHQQEKWAHIGEDRLQTSQNVGNEGQNASNGNERESSQSSSEDNNEASGSSTNTNESNNQSQGQSAPSFQGGHNQTAPGGSEESEDQTSGPQTQATAYQPETGNNRQNMTSSSSQEASADSERQIPSDTRPPPASNNWPQGNSDEQPEWKSPPPPKNNNGELSTPAPEPRPTGSLTFAPELNSNVNFYDGNVYDVSGKTSGSKERMTQAQAINNDLPSSIQKAFNDNAINHYDPGMGDFYYTKTCQGSVCNIRQVAKGCNCYVDAADGQMKTMSFDQNDKLQPSVHNWDTQLPPAARHTVAEGDTLHKVAGKYGVELGSMIAANPHISNPNVVSAGQSLNIPGQSYTVVPGDSMWAIAQAYGVPYEALRALNSQIPNPNQIKPGQVLKVPAARMEDPFVYTAPSTGGSSSGPNSGGSSATQQKDASAYTVKTGDSLWSIAQRFGVTLEEISAVNPSIKDKDLIYPGQLVNVPVYLPAQGSIKYQVSSPSEVQKRSVEAGSWVGTGRFNTSVLLSLDIVRS
jgi:LysM repeat protein